MKREKYLEPGRTLVTPEIKTITGRPVQPNKKEGTSLQDFGSIVLRGRESRPQGEGVDRNIIMYVLSGIKEMQSYFTKRCKND